MFMDLIDDYITNTASGGPDSIMSCYIAPNKFFPDSVIEDFEYNNHTYHKYIGGNVIIDTFNQSKPTSLDGYTPKNKKLLTFPYCYLVGSNNNGIANIYQYEKWTTNNCQFQISGTPTPRLLNKINSEVIYSKSRF